MPQNRVRRKPYREWKGKRLPPNVHVYYDRLGKIRNYFRRGKSKKVPFCAGVEPLTTEWWEGYLRAKSGQPQVIPPAEAIGARGIKGETWDAAIAGYRASSAYRGAKPNTQKNLEIGFRFISKHLGHVPVRAASVEDIDEVIAAKAVRHPGAARQLLNAWRLAAGYAVAKKWRPDNPAMAVKRPKLGDGQRTWTAAEIGQYRRQHALGTVARLMFEVLYATALRREDARRIGWGHVTDNVARIEPEKTRGRDQWAIFPILPELTAAIEATATVGIDTWLVNPATGEPFTNDKFGRQFRVWCDAAGLPKDLSAHGIRKAQLTRLAAAGATPHMLAAWGGHSANDLRIVALYTKKANQLLLALRAGDLLAGKAA